MFFLVFLAAQPAPIAHNLLFFDRHQIVTARRRTVTRKRSNAFLRSCVRFRVAVWTALVSLFAIGALSNAFTRPRAETLAGSRHAKPPP